MLKYNIIISLKGDNMSISQLIKKAFISCSILFTVIIVVYSLLVIAIYGGLGMNPVSVFLLLPFSYVITLANYIVKYTNLGKGVKVFIHFLMFTTATGLFVYLPHGGAFSPKNSLILFVLYCVLYAICLTVYFAVSSAKLRKSEKKSEYKNVY